MTSVIKRVEEGDKMKAKLILGILFIMIFLPLCKYQETPIIPKLEEKITLQIKGKVTDAKNGKPIYDVNICIFDWFNCFHDGLYVDTYTDSRGFYSARFNHAMTGPHVDEVNMYVTHLSYNMLKTSGGEVGLRWTDEVQRINFELDPN